MIPERIVIEYPQRCVELLDMLEPSARQQKLIRSFSLLVASSIFVIRYERMRERHPFADAAREPRLYKEIRVLKKRKFMTAPFWQGAQPEYWRFSRIMTSVNDTERWRDEQNIHPMDDTAANTIARRSADDVRNALAHGNVVYLDETGFETRGAELQYLGFLSRYEENEEQQKKSETYRLVTITEEGFLRIVKAWGKMA